MSFLSCSKLLRWLLEHSFWRLSSMPEERRISPELTHIEIYCDEAGTMPIEDDEDFFCAATICFDGNRPKIDRTPKARLATNLKKNGAAVLVTFVKPKPGYGSAVVDKFERLETMGRARRLLEGSKPKYLRPDGTLPSSRDLIWNYCMIQAISHAIGFSVTRGPISGVSVLMDPKSLAEPNRRLLLDQVFRGPGVLQGVMDDPSAPDPRAAKVIQGRLQAIRPDAISLSWRSERDPNTKWMRDGLTLADQVASRFREEAINPRESPLASELTVAGVDFRTVDLTDHLMADIDPENIEQWERDTGLRAPRSNRQSESS